MNATNAPAIEFLEWFDGLDVKKAKLICGELPTGHYCMIRRDGQNWIRKTRANGNGSIRYALHGTLADAYAAGASWARRKVAEARRDARAATT